MGVGAIELGELIRQARLRKGWKQHELAERMGVDRSYISTIEGGKRNWPQDYIAAFAEHLGLSQVEMAISAGLIEREGPAPERDPDDPAERLHTIIRALPPDKLDPLFGLAEYLLKREQARISHAPPENHRTPSGRR